MYNPIKRFKDWQKYKKAEKEIDIILKRAKTEGVLPYDGRLANSQDKEFLSKYWEKFRQASIIWMNYERKYHHR